MKFLKNNSKLNLTLISLLTISLMSCQNDPPVTTPCQVSPKMGECSGNWFKVSAPPQCVRNWLEAVNVTRKQNKVAVEAVD